MMRNHLSIICAAAVVFGAASCQKANINDVSVASDAALRSITVRMPGNGTRLGLDEAGACTLAVDGMSVVIQDVSEAGSVGFWGKIGAPPPEGLERLYELMLEANHLFTATAGATISRDPESKDFFLCRVLDLRILDAVNNTKYTYVEDPTSNRQYIETSGNFIHNTRYPISFNSGKIFDIMDACGSGNAHIAIGTLDKLIANKEPVAAQRFMGINHPEALRHPRQSRRMSQGRFRIRFQHGSQRR